MTLTCCVKAPAASTTKCHSTFACICTNSYTVCIVHIFFLLQNSQDILSENKDAYMINPCSASIWFIVELCELVSVRSLEIASFELFSSTPKSFKVYASERWVELLIHM